MAGSACRIEILDREFWIQLPWSLMRLLARR